MRRLLHWVIPVAAMLCAWSAQAGSLSVMPVVVALSDHKVREAITVTNQGDERVTTHVDVVSWTQSDGKDIFAPTTDVLLNPGVFTLEPGQVQVLRLGWRGQPPLDTERSYRILLREVPPAAPTQAPSTSLAGALPSQVRVLLELRIPIYVAPRQVVHRPEWQTRRVDGDTLDVHFSNLSNVHTVVHDLQLVSGSGAPLGEPLDVHAAVLAGQERHWSLPLPKGDAADLTVDVRADHGRQRLTIPR
ncbi:MAG: fimbria/pilus periplasmic chaperone [Gammaproteobacteria bacterium]|uniref:fimbrial biogenesis chaperone n=1 Tax=Hydrogenophaga sp. TaxID=1904254 RepID=UPI0025C60D19|nr:fimbria/pilus periplasmic chaperone [Hydrogenophaga sp.]MBU4181711.1 fimbria/pilus periplasmic chaperone [Gammaproteobacteria bacterium]MBU4279904.1 fimbria/pilus periplasmic chaperone [Gammaproteobacteria bacterium]MBU4324011.1 fimbria/pilus periplasmic chaperone [Gammaproteobacteria bacterium]MBU4505693.1 fimbria/pilus periplasmic chaperone [Gammaproteobacteria bacterium]MCG2658301.1 fimbria/pilus periplasmic chaperone [Hydrogenophaga sp.]